MKQRSIKDEKGQTTGLARLLQWSQSKTRPLWQRDALRRIICNGELEDADHDDLLSICRGAHGLPCDKPPPKPQPLTSDHDRHRASFAKGVQLLSIEHIQGVNALPPDASISFQSSDGEAVGLKVVYGLNASGKSSFARVLRSVCHTRGGQHRIWGNVYDLESPEAVGSSALFRYKIEDHEAQYNWSPESDPDPLLRTVSLFDESEAIGQLSGPNAVEFLPEDLRPLSQLAQVCDRLRTHLEKERDQVESRRSIGSRKTRFHPVTEAARVFNSLSHSTSLAEVDALARLDKKQEARRSELVRLLGDDPLKEARDLARRATRLEEFSSALKSLEGRFTDSALRDCRRILGQAVTTESAATLAAESLFKTEPLPAAGSETWKKLWEAARRYSEAEAYPSETFPVTDSGSRCVLCHQTLDPEASSRMQRFEEFVQKDTQAAATAAKHQLQDLQASLEDTPIDVNHFIRNGLQELRSLDTPTSALVRRFLRQLRQRRAICLQGLRTGTWQAPPPLITSPGDQVRITSQRLRQQVARLEKLARSEERKRLEAELAELDDRAHLRELLPIVHAEVDCLKRIHLIEKALHDIDTTQISREIGRLAQELVNAGLSTRFEEELLKLDFETATVTLQHAGGRRGIPQFHIRLDSGTSAPLPEILSEGEKRCVALAGFLAELGIRGNSSAIVLDDPVTSLDHAWRERAAKRLTEESQRRQVIIFTHDLVFLSQLLKEANRLDANHEVAEVVRVGRHLGSLRKGKPWILLNLKDRLKVLRERHVELAKAESDGDHDRYLTLYPKLYGDLRETWEQAVEEILFNATIERFDRDVRVGRITKAASITADDIRIIDENYSRCSRFHAGHLAAKADNPAPPTASTVLKDIEACNDWAKSARGRLA